MDIAFRKNYSISLNAIKLSLKTSLDKNYSTEKSEKNMVSKTASFLLRFRIIYRDEQRV